MIQVLLDDPEGFSIEGLVEYYSTQEREMMEAVKSRFTNDLLEMELCCPELKNDNGRI